MASSNREGVDFGLTLLQAVVRWPERRLNGAAFDKYKASLGGLFATLTEPLGLSEGAGQALLCRARDESTHLFVTDSDFRFGSEDIADAPAAQAKLVECFRLLPLPRKPGFALEVHVEGELVFAGLDDATAVLNPVKLGLSRKRVRSLPGRVVLCGVTLYLCEEQHKVHTSVSVTPGRRSKRGVWVYIGRTGVSFSTVPQLQKALGEAVGLAPEHLADLVQASWLQAREA